jgi:cytochrome b561
MTAVRYTPMAILLHWLMAILIVAAFPVGLIMGDLPISPTRLKLFAYHKWAGITVFWLLFIRLAWRLYHPAPRLPDSVPRWQSVASHSVQGCLYLLLIAVPVTGWLHSSAAGYSVIYLNWIPLPDLVGKDKALADTFHEIHESLNWIMLSLVVIHVAAALKHHFIDKDDILTRMSFKRGGAV